MKISYLHIRNYKQFLDLELDLTYPKGHEKAGQPLDKICIIGQSGTGKTNLLDIIKKSLVDFSEQPKNSYLPFSEFVGKDTDDRYITTKFKLFDNKIAETLFTLDESHIHGEVDFLDNEKNYFVSTDRYAIEDTNHKFDINEKKLSPVVKAMGRIFHTEPYSLPRKKTTEEKKRELEYEIYKLEDKYTTVSETVEGIFGDNGVLSEIDREDVEYMIKTLGLSCIADDRKRQIKEWLDMRDMGMDVDAYRYVTAWDMTITNNLNHNLCVVMFHLIP